MANLHLIILASKWHTHYCCTYGVWKYAFIKNIVNSGYSQFVVSWLANTWMHASFYIFVLTSAECLLTSTFLSLVVNFSCSLKLLDLIDCKVSAMASEVGAVHQLLSHCLYKEDYIRTAVSWTGSSQTHDLSTIHDLHSAPCLFHRNRSHSVHLSVLNS